MSKKFEYNYSAPSMEERKEIDSIRRQYLPKDQSMNSIDRLRKLDSKVKEIPMAWSISVGVIGTLLFGTGMTFFLEWVKYWYIGIPFALVGSILVGMAYPLHKKMSNHYKKKYGAEILEISNQLLKEEDSK